MPVKRDVTFLILCVAHLSVIPRGTMLQPMLSSQLDRCQVGNDDVEDGPRSVNTFRYQRALEMFLLAGSRSSCLKRLVSR